MTGVVGPLILARSSRAHHPRLLAGGLMLDHVGERSLAQRLRTAIDLTVNEDGIRTRDLDGGASTGEFTAAVVRRL